MLYVTVETIVKRRRELVWEALTDIDGLPAWIEGAVEAEVLRGPRRGVGARVRVARRDGRMEREATCEVTAWREHEMLALESRMPGLVVLGRVTLSTVPAGTELGVYAELASNGSFSQFFSRPRGLMWTSNDDPPVQGIYERSVRALVARIEAMSEEPYR